MSAIVDGLRALETANDAEFGELQFLVVRTYESEPARRDSIAAAVTCANLVAVSALAHERIARILTLLQKVDERASAADTPIARAEDRPRL